MTRPRFGPGGHFGDQQPARRNIVLPRGIFGRISDVDPARDHANCPRLDRPVMRRAVDPARQPRHHRNPLAAQLVRQPAREAARRGARIARPHDRHERLF